MTCDDYCNNHGCHQGPGCAAREKTMNNYIKATEFMRGPEIEGDMLTIAYMDGYARGVEAEREACAKVCEEWGAWNNTAQDCAAAIRARGQSNI